MKLGPVAITLLALGAAATAGFNLGCSRQAPPVAQPEEPPPLPPPSGTPIGHLIDSATELKLTGEQHDRLSTISDELAAQLEADDRELRPEPGPAVPKEQKPRGLGFRAGGRPGGVENVGQSGGAETFPGVADGGGNAANNAPQETFISSDTATRVYRQRARHVHAAIQRALALLDPAQQAIARRVLTDHGVNLDTGEVQGDAPGASTLEEPKLGQPLPREP
jgi:hypothetical protein